VEKTRELLDEFKASRHFCHFFSALQQHSPTSASFFLPAAMAGFERLGVMPQIIKATEEMGWLLQTPVQDEVYF
jgi:hypothetical protein